MLNHSLVQESRADFAAHRDIESTFAATLTQIYPEISNERKMKFDLQAKRVLKMHTV